jgi:hypothetical protein
LSIDFSDGTLVAVYQAGFREDLPVRGRWQHKRPHRLPDKPLKFVKRKDITMAVDDTLANEGSERSGSDIGRRDFIKRSGKALYIAPTLTLLGTAPASAQFGSPPPPPGGAPQPPAPSG